VNDIFKYIYLKHSFLEIIMEIILNVIDCLWKSSTVIVRFWRV